MSKKRIVFKIMRCACKRWTAEKQTLSADADNLCYVSMMPYVYGHTRSIMPHNPAHDAARSSLTTRLSHLPLPPCSQKYSAPIPSSTH